MGVDINIILKMIAVMFLSSIVLVPMIKIMAKHIGAIDQPNKRKIHSKPTPRLGGLAIFLSFILGIILFGEPSREILAILMGGFVITLLGIFDDINPIKARYKLLFQTVAALIVVCYGNILLIEASAFGVNIVFGTWGYPLTILFIIAIINAINLIDGLDGLAAGASSIYFLTIIIIAVIIGKGNNLEVMLSILMLGGTFGFLVYNFPPASIFMGDTGSMFLGYIISIIALLGYKAATLTSLFVPIIILLLPILDTILAIFRRILKGESVSSADKQHLHHQLLKLNNSQRKTLCIMYIVSVLCSLISILYSLGYNEITIIIYFILITILIVLIFKTDILFRHTKK